MMPAMTTSALKEGSQLIRNPPVGASERRGSFAYEDCFRSSSRTKRTFVGLPSIKAVEKFVTLFRFRCQQDGVDLGPPNHRFLGLRRPHMGQ